MTVSVFLAMLTVFSTVTSIVTECAKKIFSDKVSSNILALGSGCFVGIGGTLAYYILNAIPFTAGNITLMVLMGIASAMGAMVGYDKVTQLIEQVK